jgi:hypothetical protein
MKIIIKDFLEKMKNANKIAIYIIEIYKRLNLGGDCVKPPINK